MEPSVTRRNDIVEFVEPEPVPLVTYDADEALLLVDKITVFSHTPRRCAKAEIQVPLERPYYREEVLASPEYPDLDIKLMGY